MAELNTHISLETSNNNEMPVVYSTKYDVCDNVRTSDGPLLHVVSSTDSLTNDCNVASSEPHVPQTFENEAAQRDLRERLEVVLGKLSNKHLDSDESPPCESTNLVSLCRPDPDNNLKSAMQTNDNNLQKSSCSENMMSEVSNEYETNCDYSVLQLSKTVEEVGRYAYISLVAHSLFMLFEYRKWHR